MHIWSGALARAKGELRADSGKKPDWEVLFWITVLELCTSLVFMIYQLGKFPLWPPSPRPVGQGRCQWCWTRFWFPLLSDVASVLMVTVRAGKQTAWTRAGSLTCAGLWERSSALLTRTEHSPVIWISTQACALRACVQLLTEVKYLWTRAGQTPLMLAC